MQRRNHRVAPDLPVSPCAADSRPPARMTSSHAANLEAELGRLSATSQPAAAEQLTAENDRLKQLKTAHAHEMETIVTALQRATGAAQSSTPEIGRRAKTKATIRRLEAELASRTAGPSPGFPPAAAPPVSLALAHTFCYSVFRKAILFLHYPLTFCYTVSVFRAFQHIQA